MWPTPGTALNSCRSFPSHSAHCLPDLPLPSDGLGSVFLQRKSTQGKEGKSPVPGWFSAAEVLAWGISLELLCLSRSIGSHMAGWGCFYMSGIYRCLIAACLSNRFDNYYCLQDTEATKSVCQSPSRLLTFWHNFIKKSVSKIEIHFPHTWNIPGAWWWVAAINSLPGLIYFGIILVCGMLNTELSSYPYF